MLQLVSDRQQALLCLLPRLGMLSRLYQAVDLIPALVILNGDGLLYLKQLLRQA